MRSVVLAALLSVAASAQPTALFTYDVKTAKWPAEPEGLAPRLFEDWAGRCAAAPGGGLVVLECPPPALAELDRQLPDLPLIETRLALFRDLDETLHFAGCPDLKELERVRRRAAALRKAAPDEARALLEEQAKSRELCAEIEPGQTFSVRIEGDKLLALTRGRQLAFSLFRSDPKPREISTPFPPKPTRGSLPHAGPDTQRIAGPNPADEPVWEPARIEPPLAESKPAKTSQRAPRPAKTSLRTAIAELSCSRGAARIHVDEAEVGLAPLRIPLMAGPHTVEARLDGRLLGAVKLEIEAGESLELDVCGNR